MITINTTELPYVFDLLMLNDSDKVIEFELSDLYADNPSNLFALATLDIPRLVYPCKNFAFSHVATKRRKMKPSDRVVEKIDLRGTFGSHDLSEYILIWSIFFIDCICNKKHHSIGTLIVPSRGDKR
jgi:hypothetical protein